MTREVRNEIMSVQIKVYSSNSMHGVLDELAPAFERVSGNKLSVSYDLPQVMLKRIEDGQPVDLVIMAKSAIDALEKQAKIVAGSPRILARFGIGICVRSGTPKPDIGSVELLKRALLNARSIAHTSEGASGVHFSSVVERLGIADQVRAKAVTRPGGLIAELVVSGEAEMAVQQMPELLSVPGIELVGPLPQEFQVTTTSAAAIAARAKQPEAARALMEFLLAPASAPVFRAKGLEPAGGN